MKKLLILFLLFSQFSFAQETKKKKTFATYHYVCNLTNDTYHNMESCAELQMCRGGRYRRVKNIEGLTPCRRCVRTTKAASVSPTAYANIKGVLGVKDKKQIADSLGTSDALITRPNGITLVITGPPNGKTVNQIEFYFKDTVPFNPEILLSKPFFEKLGLQFAGCRADTIRNTTPHPITGKTKNDFSIEYRGCANVEPRTEGEDTTKYYYELVFVPKESDGSTVLDKVQLLIRN
jgi:hypothetical protein